MLRQPRRDPAVPEVVLVKNASKTTNLQTKRTLPVFRNAAGKALLLWMGSVGQGRFAHDSAFLPYPKMSNDATLTTCPRWDPSTDQSGR